MEQKREQKFSNVFLFNLPSTLSYYLYIYSFLLKERKYKYKYIKFVPYIFPKSYNFIFYEKLFRYWEYWNNFSIYKTFKNQKWNRNFLPQTVGTSEIGGSEKSGTDEKRRNKQITGNNGQPKYKRS